MIFLVLKNIPENFDDNESIKGENIVQIIEDDSFFSKKIIKNLFNQKF